MSGKAAVVRDWKSVPFVRLFTKLVSSFPGFPTIFRVEARL
jgi:hypothetical protein